MIDLSNVDVDDLLTRLDISNARLTSSGTEMNFSCFGAEHSHGDESPSAYINVETTAWFCHGCKRRGNAVTLVMEAHDCERPTAERELREWYGIDFLEPIGGSMAAEIEKMLAPPIKLAPRIPPPESWLFSSKLDWRTDDPEAFQVYMIERGFTPETLEAWEIGYDFVTDRITIPVRDLDGNLYGVKGRDWRGDHPAKYLGLGDTIVDGEKTTRWGFDPYETATVVFGLHRRRDVRRAVLCEGELNDLALDQLGVERPIATGMSYLTERHAQLIARECEEVVLYYDYGKAGHEGMYGSVASSGQRRPGAIEMLESYVRIFVVEPTPEDPAELLRLGRGQEALNLIAAAKSSLTAITAYA